MKNNNYKPSPAIKANEVVGKQNSGAIRPDLHLSKKQKQEIAAREMQRRSHIATAG